MDVLRVRDGQAALQPRESERFPAMGAARVHMAAVASSAPDATEGFLTFQCTSDLAGLGAGTWLRRYVVFDGAALRMWQYPEHVAGRAPEGELRLGDVTDDTVVKVG